MKLLASIFSPNGSATGPAPRTEQDQTGYVELYSLLWSMFFNNSYDDLTGPLETRFEGVSIHPIKNPTARVVNFYSTHIWPGALREALPIEAENERIVEPIRQLWRWTNWGSQKQVFARRFALLGNPFIKVVGRDDRQRVFFQLIDESTVTDFEADERDNIKYIRLDIETLDERGERVIHVEVWDKETETYRQWVTDQLYKPLEELGIAVEEQPLQAFGIDFVPFVHAKFRDIGEPRGIGAVTLSLRKIWEADLIATSLHQRLFRYNKPDWVMSAASPEAGKYGAPPDLSNVVDHAEQVQIDGETYYGLPAGWDLRSLVANVDYRSALAILQEHMRELEADMPELAWYRLRELGQISGRAVRMLLSDPIANALEARGNAETALVKANMMALSMMQNFGLVRDIGSFDAGDFEHGFEHRDIIPLNDMEEAESEYQQALGDAVLVNQLGYSKEFVQQKRGLSEETIAAMKEQNDSTGDEVGSQILRMFDSGNLG
jgi:hypothetical protein